MKTSLGISMQITYVHLLMSAKTGGFLIIMKWFYYKNMFLHLVSDLQTLKKNKGAFHKWA